jgi:hypothetical protein
MSDDKVLTKEIAVQFLTDRDSVDLSDFITIDNEAARILSQVEGTLDLSGLEYFADTPDHLALVEKLSQHDGELCLMGLTSLSDAAAESLSKHEGELVLCRLTSLSDAAAESLSKHDGNLYLDGLTSLSDASAESLSKHKGDLYLLGLTSLSDGPGHIALAEILSKHEGGLDLSGLTSLSDAAAESLCKLDSDNLSINLDNLPASAAQILRDAGHGV